MRVTFTPTGDSAVTLADSSAAPLIAGVLEQFGGASLVQTEKRYGQSTEIDFPRGNIGGDFIFTAGCSYATLDAAAGAFAAAFALLNEQGSLAFTPNPAGSVTLTMANAILRDVHRVKWDGVRLELRYTFKITTITT